MDFSQKSSKEQRYQRSLLIHSFKYSELSAQIISQKYFNVFNQHLINEINEILICKTNQTVVRFKDYLFYDDENEFLENYYDSKNIGYRLPNILKFYLSLKVQIFPNVSVLDRNRLMFKYFKKKNKLLLIKSKHIKQSDQAMTEHKTNNNRYTMFLEGLVDNQSLVQNSFSRIKIENSLLIN